MLQPGGTFVAITHSEKGFSSLLRSLGVPPEHSALRSMIGGFSAENGAALLGRHFARWSSAPTRTP